MYAGPATTLVWFTPRPAYFTGSDACSHWSSVKQALSGKNVVKLVVELIEGLLQKVRGTRAQQMVDLVEDGHPAD